MANRNYKIKRVVFLNHDDFENREVVVTLDNDTKVHIVSCFESWQQWGGTRDELWATTHIADAVNKWLHDENVPIPDDYDYID